MKQDMCVPCDGGIINLRVGAIIAREGKLLMVGNEGTDYLYSVGGRIKFGETAEEAVVREVEEETGTRLEIDRLGFVHENYFVGDSPYNRGKLIYEIALYFYMKVPKDFSPNEKNDSVTEGGSPEFLRWVDPLTCPSRFYPDFFKTDIFSPGDGVKWIKTAPETK